MFCHLTLTRTADLEFHPRALHAVRTEHEEQFIIDADGVINLLMEFPATLDVMRCKPDAEPCILQAPMEPAAEVFIGTTVADEAGVELDRFAQERREVLNQRFWQTTAPEKGEGERPGFGEGAMVEGAGANVAAGL